jgi:autotransporter-associated beta strand protein
MQRLSSNRLSSHSVRARCAASASALAAALIAIALSPTGALAQATPGSPQCPVVNNVVTCSGALPDGVAVTSGAYQGLTVTGVAGDMAASSRPVILYRSDQASTLITLDDPDSTIVLTTAETTSGTARLTGAVTATLTAPNTSFALTNSIDIAINEQPGSVNATARDRPFGLLVEGSGGSFSLTNSGDVTLTGVDFVTDSGGIGMAVSNAQLVRVVNSGDIRFVVQAGENGVNGFGIAVEADNRRIEIENAGDILLPNGNAIYGIYVSGDAIELTSTPGVTRPTTPARTLESYRIVNSGTIAAADRGIFVSDFNEAIGAPTGEIVNTGTIRSEFGIILRHPGAKSVLNSGIIEARAPVGNEFITFFGIDVSGNAGNAPQAPGAAVRIENAAGGVLRSSLEFSRGVNLLNTPATVINGGSIALTGPESVGIISSMAGNFVGLTEIANGGTIDVAGAEGRGIRTSLFAPGTGLVPDTRISNSGTIAATGSNAVAIDYFSDAAQGLSTIDLAATSVVRGGSGTGAAIRIVGGERHAIVNRGLIAAASGQAVAGGAAIETLDTSGRIEGSAALAAGNDSVTMRAGAVQLGTLDGGADTDALLFDVAAAGEASVTGAILNFESVRKTGTGTLVLRDTGTISPGLSFEAGTLLAEGNLGATAIAAPNGTRLGGSGSLGAAAIADGATIAPGREGVAGTLTVASLDLSPGSILRYDLAAPGGVGGTSDLIQVTGALRLDGRLDVNPLPGFGPGIYRLINYGGALTDNGLVVGTAPEGQYQVQTSVAGQVNLVLAEAGPGPTPPIQFWDGPDTAPDGMIDGGSGSWGGTRTNWTRANGQVNEAWNGNFAVFQGAAGTVTVDTGGVGVTGMQFAVSGYSVTGGPITLSAPATIRVGDGSAGGGAMSATIASAISGTGGLAKTDLGTLVLSGANSYTGGTTISSGVLQVSADNALGAASGGLTLDGGTLRIGGAITSARTVAAGPGGGTIDTQGNALSLTGPLQGAGALTKTGTGTLTLGGASTGYTGRFNLAAGALRLDGSIGGTLETAAGTTLSGTGTANNLVVAGTLSPGNSIGTMNVAGNATFRSGSTFAVELNSAGGVDRLAVAGTVTIEGGTVAVTALDPELNYTDGSTFTFLTAAGGRTGTFAGLTESSAFLDFALGYTATSAFLTVDVIRTFPEVAATFNQTQAATGLRAFGRTPGSDSLAVYNTILLLDEGPARGAFDVSSGEIYPVLMASTLRTGEGIARRLGLRAYAGAGEGLGLWGGIQGANGRIDADGNGARFSYDDWGGEIGIDYRGAGNRWAFGFGGGYLKGDVSLRARSSEADYDGWHAGGFARLGTGGEGFSASAAAAYLRTDADVTRAIAFGTLGRTAAADMELETVSFSADLRYGVRTGGAWSFGPIVSIAHASTDLGAFAETGANSLGLSGAGSDDSRTRYGGGVFANLAGPRGSIDFSVQYVAGNGELSEAELSLAGAAATAFRIRSAAGDDEMVRLGVAGDYDLGGGWSVGGDIRAAFGSNERDLAGSVVLRLGF